MGTPSRLIRSPRFCWRDLFLIGVIAFLVVDRGLPVIRAFAEGTGGLAPATVLSDSFAYQGRLEQDGVPGSGNFDFEFSLFAVATGGTALVTLPPLTNVPVINGLFSVQLNFGAGRFVGDERWIEVRVKPSASGSFALLGQRQAITATPYALYAKGIPLAGDGTSSAAARSDHNHFAETWTGSVAGEALIINNTNSANGAALAGLTTSGGVGVVASQNFGLEGYAPDGTCGTSLAPMVGGAFAAGCLANQVGLVAVSFHSNSIFGLSRAADSIVGKGGSGFAGVMGVSTNGANTNWGVYSVGKLGVEGTISSLSDARLKQNIVGLESGIDAVKRLRPVRFDWSGTPGVESEPGFTAQDVAEVFPELVTEGKDGHLLLDYSGLIPVLARAIQEQQAEIEELRVALAGR